MDRFKNYIYDEIFNYILKWTNYTDTSKDFIEVYFDDCCSIWDGYEEVKFYLEEDGETISLEELKDCDWCVELSNGEVLMLG